LVEASGFTHLLWDKLDAEQKRKFRNLLTTPPVPGIFILSHPGLDVSSIQKKLKRFENDELGRQFFVKSGLQGFVPISNDDLQMIQELYQ
jgi:hypothetical protein